MNEMMKKFLKCSISAIAIVAMLLSTKLSLLSFAADKGSIQNGDTITIQIGDTVKLECKRPYGYDSLTPSWSVDADGIISIIDDNPGDTYSSITSATIEGEAEGTANITMKAVSPWGEYWGVKTETFTVVVEGNTENTQESSEEPSSEEPSSEGPQTDKDDSETNPTNNDEEATETDTPNTTDTDDNKDSASLYGKTLYVRLLGSYSHMMQGEEDIDAVSSATGVGYKPQEANAVKVQAVLVNDGTDKSTIPEDAWQDVEYFNFDQNAIRPNSDTSKTKVNVTPECPGMEFFYNIWNGKIEASGKATQAGKYDISIEFTDADGRVAKSNSIVFTVYDLKHTLLDSLTYENSTKTSDGKYIYDQTPWYITDLGADTVVVPKDIKAWYGSHSTGTYAEVGEIISLTNGEQPSHTLVIPSGANLTLLNTRIHSDVKIVVENGAKLTLRQSTIEGIIEIQNDGVFSVDYNDFGTEKGFSSGSALNGQLILQDGAILENAHIVSHTNYSARDDVNRKNNKPVVVVNGNVTINGEVVIKADEAADYGIGQQGMQVNGTLSIPAGSSLEVYGGGESQLTSKGGDAIVLNNGTIKGDGKLIAVGGFGMNVTADRSLLGGGSAISGKGNILIEDVTLNAGNSFENVDIPNVTESIVLGSSIANKVNDDTKTANVETKEASQTSDTSDTSNTSDTSDSETSNTTSSSTSNASNTSSAGNSSDSSNSGNSSNSSNSNTEAIVSISDTVTPLSSLQESSVSKKSYEAAPSKTIGVATTNNELSENDTIENTKADKESTKDTSTSNVENKKIDDENVPLSAEKSNSNKLNYIVFTICIIALFAGCVAYKKFNK